MFTTRVVPNVVTFRLMGMWQLTLLRAITTGAPYPPISPRVEPVQRRPVTWPLLYGVLLPLYAGNYTLLASTHTRLRPKTLVRVRNVLKAPPRTFDRQQTENLLQSVFVVFTPFMQGLPRSLCVVIRQLRTPSFTQLPETRLYYLRLNVAALWWPGSIMTHFLRVTSPQP